MAKTAYYILVGSPTQAFGLYQKLHESGCRVRVAPVPRGVTACCGTCVMVDPDALEEVQRALSNNPSFEYDEIVQLENAIDPNRDVFC